MNQTWTVETFVYLTTALCALLLLPRSANWRLRLIIGTIGLQGLSHAVTQMRLNHPFWQSRLGTITGVVEMFAGALALTAIYLLKKENVARKSTDARLRLSEADEKTLPQPAAKQDGAISGARLVADAREGISQIPRSSSSPSHSGPHRKLRQSRRFSVSLSAQVTRLDGEGGEFGCEVADISRGGLRLRMTEFIPPGGLVKIEFRDVLYLGEVCRCDEVEGHYEAGVKFEHLLNLASLAKLLREIGFEAKDAAGRQASPSQEELAVS